MVLELLQERSHVDLQFILEEIKTEIKEQSVIDVNRIMKMEYGKKVPTPSLVLNLAHLQVPEHI